MKKTQAYQFERALDEFSRSDNAVLAGILNNAGVYCAHLVLREQAGDEKLPADQLNAIPVLRMQLCTKQKDGLEMAVAATTAISAYMVSHPVRESGWFKEARKAGKNAARKVFKAGFFVPEQREIDPYVSHEVWNYRRMLSGKPAPELHDEGRAYRTRREGNFYVHDAVVPATVSSITVSVSLTMAETAVRGNAGDKAVAYDIAGFILQYINEHFKSKERKWLAHKFETNFANMVSDGRYYRLIKAYETAKNMAERAMSDAYEWGYYDTVFKQTVRLIAEFRFAELAEMSATI